MLRFFSSSSSVVNSKRAIAECLENALKSEPDLDCDLMIIYAAMGHNFKDLLAEAKRLSPNAMITGCTGGGIIGKNGADESLKALAVMAVKGPHTEFAITFRDKNAEGDPYSACYKMASDLKKINPGINIIQIHPSGGGGDFMPMDKGLDGIKAVFGRDIPVFGGLAMTSLANIRTSETVDDPAQFYQNNVLRKGAIMIGYADPTLKYISKGNHGFNVLESMPFEVTKADSSAVYELNGLPAWKIFIRTLDVPEEMSWVQALTIAGFAYEIPPELSSEYGSRYSLFAIMGNNKDGSIITPVTCKKGMKLWLTRRDEKQMFEGVDWLANKVASQLNGITPLAVFHSDCVLRGRFSLDRILKDELIHRLQSPVIKGSDVPWFGLYSAGEITMLGGEAHVGQFSSSLFVLYR